MNTRAPSSAAEPAAVDADLRTQLDDALAAEPVDAGLASRVKRRLLHRLAAEATPRHPTVHAGEPSWQPFGAGVAIKVLHEADGVMSYLLRLAAGATRPAHRHPMDEECVVLEGSIEIGSELRVEAGGFHLGLRGVHHAAITSRDGATIFLRGASPHPAHLL